jgi:dihydrofolate reductase
MTQRITTPGARAPDAGPEAARATRALLACGVVADVAEEVSKLKQRPGGDILINGSARLVQSLMEHDLIDEYRLMVFPIVLGSGKRLFDGSKTTTTLRLVQATPVGPDGVLVLTYEPARDDKASDPS